MTRPILQFVDVATNQASKFGAWARNLRQERRLTIEALAKKAGISKQYLSVLERGQPHALTGKAVTPKVELVDRIAKALNVDADEARLAAGYAPSSPVEAQGFFSGYYNLPPDRQELARRQIKGILDSLADKNHDTNYIDDE